MKMKLMKALLLSLMTVILCSPSFAEDEVIRVGVLRFESKANGISRNNAESITDELTRMLTNSYSIAIIDRSAIEAIAREHRMNLAGLIDPRTAARLGQAAGIQYLITGAITHYSMTEEVKHSDTKDFWNMIIPNDKKTAERLSSKSAEKIDNAEITLDVKIIEINTQEVVLAMAETGKASRTTKVTAGSSSQSATVQNVDLRDSAVSDAVSRIGQRIKEAVAGEYPQVLRVNGKDIFIGPGAKSGAKEGDIYKVGIEGEEIQDMRGKVVGREISIVAIIRIEDVKNDYSVARVIRKGGNPANIQRGDRIDLSSEEEANKIIRRKEIIDRRPKKRFSDVDSNLDSRPNDEINSGYEPKAEPVHERRLENFSTDPSRVIPTYGLPAGEARVREELHRKLQRTGKTKNAYNHYAEMANSYKGDYLAMYQAGIIAQSLGRRNDAAMWFDKALSANPNYEPARKAKENMSKPAPSRTGKGKKRRK